VPHTSPITIRELRTDHPDVAVLDEEVQAYYVSLYGGPDGSPMDHDEFTPPAGAFFLGYDDDVPVSMGGWRHHSPVADYPAQRPAEIKRMYVRSSARGRGLARQMLAHLERTAAAAGADALILETGQVQPDAIALYRSSGFVDIPDFGFYAGEELAVHLGKPLR
jgi:GNAT superfamily N-acetyltransferase